MGEFREAPGSDLQTGPIYAFMIFCVVVFGAVVGFIEYHDRETHIFREACLKDGHSIEDCERLFP